MSDGGLPGKRQETAAAVDLDLRGLDPPEPMLAILATIDAPGEARPVTVTLDRDPIFLLPELAARGWSYAYLDAGGDAVRLRLTRTP